MATATEVEAEEEEEAADTTNSTNSSNIPHSNEGKEEEEEDMGNRLSSSILRSKATLRRATALVRGIRSMSIRLIIY